MPEDRLSMLRTISFCAGLPDAALAALGAIAIPLQRPAGALILIEGDRAEAMYLIMQGQVKIARTSANGREQVLNVLGQGQHFNTVPMFDDGLCPANVQALTNLELLALPRDPLRQAVERHPELALALLKEFTGRLRHMVNLIDDLALHTVQGRLAGLLLDYAAAAERGEAAPPPTQAELAARIGTVREMVGRALKTFEALHLIKLDRGAITLQDRAGLAAQREA